MVLGRWSIFRCTMFAALLALTLSTAVKAQNANWPPPLSVTGQQLSDPMWWPNDPGFAGDWDKWAWSPQVVLDNPNISAEEKAAGIGMGVDAAWQRSKGDPTVIIAVMDSGFLWDREDLLNKWYLNRNELPPPNRTDCVGTDPYDCNGDGVFNIRDYTTAGVGQLPHASLIADATLLARPDHGDVNGNGWLDPQDLIAIFSDGKDGYGTTVVDGNGYVDDICGWDFLWDDNDPTDDVLNGGQGYSHGSAEASDSANEGNNGDGDIGGCPACMVIPLRTGDSFVAHATHQAMAMYYGVSRGVSVFQAAQITLENSPMAQDAINYAWAHGAVLVASSADETSLHQMVPGNLEHPIVVNGHYYDGSNWDDPNNTTFTNFSNGTNWGGHIALSGNSSSGSDSTARHAGVFGLIFSYARQLGMTPPLSAAEAYQLAIEHTFDINKPGTPHSTTNPDGTVTYSDFYMGPGWDAHSGYGRVNARASLDAMAAGQIPPAVDITSPLWFDFFDPTRVPTLTVTGVVNGARATGFDYTIEAAYGLEPTDDLFHPIGQGSGTGNLDVSASLPLAGLVANVAAAPGVDARTYPNGGPHQFAVTLRIRATAHYGGTIGDAKGEARKTIFVHEDDDLLPGYPHKLANSGNAGPSASGESSPKLIDLDGDGKDEMVFGTSDGYVHAMKMDFTELPGFPVRVGREQLFANHPGAVVDDAGANDAYQEILSTPAIGDIDGDGKMEIVIGTIEGSLYAIRLDGSIEPGFPMQLGDATLPKEVPDGVGGFKKAGMWTTPSTDGGLPVQRMNEVEKGFFASPVLADLDGDGKLDIVQAGLDGYMHVLNYKGVELPGFPVAVRDPVFSNEGDHDYTIRGRLIGTPAVGDVDGDGKPEILSGSNEAYGNNTSGRAYLIRNNGAFQTGWPIKLAGVDINVLPYVGRGNPDSPIIADIDGDGVPELFTHVVATQAKAYDLAGNEVLEMSTDNTSQYSTATSKQGFDLIAVNMGSVADLDGDGKLDYIDGTIAGYDLITGSSGAVRHDYDHQVNVWSAGRTVANGQDQAPMFDAFPQMTTDYQFLTNYTVADINGDGYPEIISDNGGYLVTAFDSEGKAPAGWPKLTGYWNMATPAVGDLDGDGYLDVVVVSRNGYLWAWKTKGKADQKLQWESYHHDLQNTGDFATKEIVRKGPGGSSATDHVGGGGCSEASPEIWALFGAALVLIRNRRRAV